MILPDYLSQILGLSPLSHPILEPNASWYYGCSFGFSGSGALRAGNNPGPLPDQVRVFPSKIYENSTSLASPWKSKDTS